MLCPAKPPYFATSFPVKIRCFCDIQILKSSKLKSTICYLQLAVENCHVHVNSCVNHQRLRFFHSYVSYCQWFGVAVCSKFRCLFEFSSGIWCNGAHLFCFPMARWQRHLRQPPRISKDLTRNSSCWVETWTESLANGVTKHLTSGLLSQLLLYQGQPKCHRGIFFGALGT